MPLAGIKLVVELVVDLVCCGSGVRLIPVVIGLLSQALSALRGLLSSKDASIVQETCFAISNVAAGTPVQIAAVLENNLIPSIVLVARSGQTSRARRCVS